MPPDDEPADVQLARRCLAGDAEAVAALEQGPLAAAHAHLVAMGFAAPAIDEAVQRARHKLIVDGGLAAYRGRGPLAAFIKTSLVRLAIDDRRALRHDVEVGELLASASADPELEYMRRLYAQHLVEAVRDAWQRLAAHERFLLSLRLQESLSIDDLARVYQIHRASAARRAAAARASLISHTRHALRERLAVGDGTIDSILRIVTTSVQLPLDEPLDG